MKSYGLSVGKYKKTDVNPVCGLDKDNCCNEMDQLRIYQIWNLEGNEETVKNVHA
jgi:hypothetical protein